MSFHPDKCNVLRVTKKRTPLNSTYKLKGQELAELSTSKYLGFDLSSNLDWKEHIDRTVKKANSVLGFLRRNLRINNRETKSSAYVTLVRPHLEYCASIWSLIQTNPSRNWRWFKEDQLGTAPIDTTTQVVSQICYRI